MLERLLQIDTDLLLVINAWHSPWADTLMWIISAKTTWIPLYLLLIGSLVWRYRQPSPKPRYSWIKTIPTCVIMIVVIALAVGMADFIASGILKPLVARPRPTRVPDLEGVIHLVNGYRSGKYGFVSSHAANTMACAMLFALVWKRWRCAALLMLWVGLNSYSRMYLGVHYPTDILCGWLIGAVAAWLVYGVIQCLVVLPEKVRK